MNKVKSVVVPMLGISEKWKPWNYIANRGCLPILNYPAIYYILKEANIFENIIVIINPQSKSLVPILNDYNPKVRCIMQYKPYGISDALAKLQYFLPSEDNICIISPNIVFSTATNPSKMLIKAFNKYQKSILLVKKVEKESLKNYDTIQRAQRKGVGVRKISSIVDREDSAISEVCIMGRYIISYKKFSELISYGEPVKISFNDFLRGILEKEDTLSLLTREKHFNLNEIKGFVEANKYWYNLQLL